jgi:hypothetical protein
MTTDATTKSCDWCGNPGHTPDDHPLPKSHPHFDPDLDDNPLLEVALADFTDFLDRKNAPTKSTPAVLSPMERLIGRAGTPPTCNTVVHWWDTNAKSGTLCLCGMKIKAEGSR